MGRDQDLTNIRREYDQKKFKIEENEMISEEKEINDIRMVGINSDFQTINNFQRVESKVAEIQQEIEKEVKAETDKLTEVVEKKIKELKNLQAKQDEKLNAYKLASKAKTVRKGQKILDREKDVIKEKNLKCEHGKKRLEELRKELDGARNQTIVNIQQGFKTRQDLRADHDANSGRKTDEYHKQLLALAESRKHFMISQENRLKKLTEKKRDIELTFLDENAKLDYWNLETRKDLMNATHLEIKNEERRIEHHNISLLYGSFKTVYNREEMSFITTLLEARKHERLTNEPETEVLTALFVLTDALENLKITDLGLVECRKLILESSKKLRENFEKFLANIAKYSNTTSEEKGVIYKSMTHEYENVKESVKKIGEMVLEFNIEQSKDYDAVFEKQWDAIMQMNISTKQITNKTETETPIVSKTPIVLTTFSSRIASFFHPDGAGEKEERVTVAL
ncbi:hypothetical protein CRE_17923 [Caenorhabditis remanei]|uniref:Uncharacterized protein n=1 Tax=Caenorhabditis remanei TaxID=31234 RepID=E3MDK2_CAERE|nr:hypothetical protein CRE_17923 [Caenorhabditis remanei]